MSTPLVPSSEHIASDDPAEQRSDVPASSNTDARHSLQEESPVDSSQNPPSTTSVSAYQQIAAVDTPPPPDNFPHSDAASARSLPTVHVSGSHSSPASNVHGAQVASSSQASFDSAASRSLLRASVAGASPSSPSRRSIAPSRASGSESTRAANRLSGFFSNLINRRDGSMLHSSLSSTPQELSRSPEGSANASRASSPMPPKQTNPPPPLPPPTLQELGLSLSVLTRDLSPSHFSTPPASGAFLSPHYLLLCHAQGLDVLPLTSPPAPQPYALIRRVPFKSVVVMEHRGVLVAIAGRRDGVRVYALDEVKKAIEWRLDVEVRRERERARREEAKRSVLARESFPMEKSLDIALLSSASIPKNKTSHKHGTSGSHSRPSSKRSKTPSSPVVSATPGRTSNPTTISTPQSSPPSYRSPSPPQSRIQPSAISSSPRRGSVTTVLNGTISRRNTDGDVLPRPTGDAKADWQDGSDDEEAINVMTAGPSGSQALDERTSAMAAASTTANALTTATMSNHSSRRGRPSDLDITIPEHSSPTRIAPPSPTPTLLTLRQALLSSPPANHSRPRGPLAGDARMYADGPSDDELEPERGGGRTPTNERITFAEALQESRLPDLPPPGSRLPQEAILITQSHPIATGDEDMPAPASPTGSSHTARNRKSMETIANLANRRRRRWSVLDNIFTNTPAQSQSSHPLPPSSALTNRSLPSSSAFDFQTSHRPPIANNTEQRRPNVLTRSHSGTSLHPPRPSTVPNSVSTMVSENTSAIPPMPMPPSRFLSRILNTAFGQRRSEDDTLESASSDVKGERKSLTTPTQHSPAPKLEYVKLPGTKNALLIKAVETSKKSFLAILCGENGEKVELFAGTYRTALGLSRTFILPDSPRSLELQLQGDDLVEVFLVFAQNVFGLEPATVRVREVRIGRAERRAARRRARELRGTEDPQASGTEIENAPIEETTTVTVSVGVGPLIDETSSDIPTVTATTTTIQTSSHTSRAATPAAQDELLAVQAAQMGPYTTFQQLPFSPHFPLAAIADEYIIPPTYLDFLQYRAEHEPDGEGAVDLAQIQFSPPGLPLPTPTQPSNWFYRDPKGNIHGPWSSAQMHSWYREGLLPLDLPVRREEELEYTLLKDLRQQCIDPTHPFRSAPAPRSFSNECSLPVPLDPTKPLLQPLSLLTQSRIFGPPALFYSTRGGHSTVIVDARGRSVLKGRFLWTPDGSAEDQASANTGRLGDVKRLEAFDVENRSILVAMRQGGFEVVDFSDALLKPADSSRHFLPQYATTPSQVNRRLPFTWKIGMPVGTATSSATSLLPLKSHSRLLHAPVKKLSTGPGKSPARSEFGAGDGDNEHTRDEVIFLGRKDDDIYICERNGGAFRILRLCPNVASQ